MQKELPRPERVELSALLESAAALADPAEALVAKEAALLIAHDAARYPLGKSAIAAKPVPLQQIDDDTLAEARLQILAETRHEVKPAEVAATFNRENSNAILLGLGCYEDDDEDDEIATMRSAIAVSLRQYYRASD